MKSVIPAAVLLAAVSLQAATTTAQAATANEPAPNILLVIADDMGLDATTCYNVGNQQAPMPTLEELCANGLVFENAYAAPVCSPTRASIMSGQHGFQTGIGGAISRRGDSGGLSDSIVSLFDLLATTDHSAALIGKWHLASGADGLDHPKALGVDHYFGLYSGRTEDYNNWESVENGKSRSIQQYTTSAFTDHAIDWIGQQDSPWFLWLAHNAPHAPFHLPPNSLHSFDDLQDTKTAINANPLPYYQSMLEALDTELGRLLNSLSADTRDNTLVIFMGDNGTPNQVSRSLYNKGAKGTLFEAGIHIPFVVAGAGVTSGRTDALVSAVDLYTTIARLTGAQSNAAASYDFSAVLSGGNTERDTIYAEHFSNRSARGANTYGWSLRQDHMKLINIEGQPLALYDLATDPGEHNNLLSEPATERHLAIANTLQNRKKALTKDSF